MLVWFRWVSQTLVPKVMHILDEGFDPFADDSFSGFVLACFATLVFITR